MQKDLTKLTDEQIREKLNHCLESRSQLYDSFFHKRNKTIIKTSFIKNVEHNIKRLEAEEDRRKLIRRLSGETTPKFE